jgi:FlaA1/EpsC-like NDP-sugar epimerase
MTLMPHSKRTTIAITWDVMASVLAFVAALYLRLGEGTFDLPASFYIQTLCLIAAATFAASLAIGSHRSSWRYFSVGDVVTLGKTCVLTLLLFLPVSFVATRAEGMPRSTYVLAWLLLFVGLAAPRLAYRLVSEGRLSLLQSSSIKGAVPILLVGSGDGADSFLRALAKSQERIYRPVGIIDDRAWRTGIGLHGVPVLGGLERLSTVIEELATRGERPLKLVVTDHQAPPDLLRKLLELAEFNGLTLSRTIAAAELRPGIGLEEPRIKPVAIEDLLGRPQAVLDMVLPRNVIAGKRVLITGAGGSIGSELARQVAAIGPSQLCLADASEFNLYTIDLEISERAPQQARSSALLDVRDRRRVEEIVGSQAPDIIFHAAALKHVPIVEAHPLEGLFTNVFGTRNVADAAVKFGVSEMVLISTDKAVNPPNVMGASKRLAEAYCQARDVTVRTSGGRTRFATVRFGNVLGSTGSVVPLFQRQLASGGPLTVTHPDVTRYFMTVPEAVALVLQAAGLSAAGKLAGGVIMVLDMGQPVRIADLARQMIRLAGYQPDRDIEIKYVGLRAGEKLHEELFHMAEEMKPTEIPGVLIAAPRSPQLADLLSVLHRLEASIRQGDEATAIDALCELVPEYTGKANG